MEENPNPALVPAEPTSKACINCGNPDILKGYPNALCSECRNKFIKFPIPLWMKFFAAGIGALVLFSLVTLPKNLSAGVVFEQGVRAEKEKKFVTAQHQMEAVLKMSPDYKEAKAHLLIAAFYNSDMSTFADMATQLVGQNVDDDVLFGKVDAILSASKDYFPGDSLFALMKQYPDSTGGIADTMLESFVTQYPEDVFAKYQYAALLDNEKKYRECDSVYQSILKINNEYMPALIMIAGIKRIEGNTKASLSYCDNLLAINQESTDGLSSKARTLLKMNKEKEALELALKSFTIDNNDPYTNATLAMAYHFNNMLKERDALFEKAKSSKDSTAAYYFKYAQEVIDNKEKL